MAEAFPWGAPGGAQAGVAIVLRVVAPLERWEGRNHNERVVPVILGVL